MKTFPTIILAAFIVLGVLGVIIISTYSAITRSSVGTVMVWGPLSSETMRPVLDKVREINVAFDGVKYQYVSEETIIPELIAAIASGRSPDLVFFPASHIVAENDKLLTISYSTFSRRDFQDTFVEAGEVFLFSDGVKGLPVLIDPLVMYWNRSLFSSAGIASPPRYWDDVTTLASQLSRSDERGTLTQSAVAFGTWDNILYAKPILLTLLRQLGNPVVQFSDAGFESVLEDATGTGSSASSALRFYTDFADPVKSSYSWNRAQPSSRDAFIGGKLAIYIGRASELYGLRQANPNLNFDVAPVPSVRGGGSFVEAQVFGLSISRGSLNPDGALLTAQALTAPDIQGLFENTLHVPSVLRSALTSSPDDPYVGVFRNAAIASFSFLDPDPSTTDSLFSRMVANVTSGNLTVSEAIGSAARELGALVGRD